MTTPNTRRISLAELESMATNRESHFVSDWTLKDEQGHSWHLLPFETLSASGRPVDVSYQPSPKMSFKIQRDDCECA